MEQEYKTLPQLNVKPGDVVEYKEGGKYTISNKPQHLIWTDGSENKYKVWDYGLFRIVSRADTPKRWNDMTTEEKGALLLAKHEGKVIEYSFFGSGGWIIPMGEIGRHTGYYRIKPNNETVSFKGYVEDGVFFRGRNSSKPEVKITFDLIDGNPDVTSIKMEELE
jgi:hypothetical protein